MVKYYAYIVECNDGSLYTGYARDVAARVEKHNLGTGAKYTRNKRPVKLKYQEEYDSRSGAMKREVQIKKLTRREKLTLIEGGA